MELSSILVRGILGATGRSKLNVLVYHRIHASLDPLFPSSLDARGFDEQLSWIESTLTVVPLREAIEMLRNDRLPARAACITFDDGYADNVEVALPVLRRHRMPATFFIATGYLDGGRMFNDTIIESIRRASGDALDLEALGLGRQPIETPEARRSAITHVIDRLKYLPQAQRQEQADSVARIVGATLPDDLMMRTEQVLQLHRTGMTIGAHTVTHPILSQLGDAQARTEMEAGRQQLESVIGSQVQLFAYPNGKLGQDYEAKHADMARQLGFAAAFSTRWGAADPLSDVYQLPRFTPWGRTLLRFGAGLARSQLGRL